MDERTRKLMFSHESKEWYTPLDIYRELDDEFHFDIDPSADPTNRLGCRIFYTALEDGLSKDWPPGNVFCNPPYGREGKAHLFVKKCAEHAAAGKGVAVLLIASRTDTDWYHRYIWDYDHPRPNVSVRPVKGRIKFIPGPTNPKKSDAAAFASLVVIFWPPPGKQQLEQEQTAAAVVITERKRQHQYDLNQFLQKP